MKRKQIGLLLAALLVLSLAAATFSGCSGCSKSKEKDPAAVSSASATKEDASSESSAYIDEVSEDSSAESSSRQAEPDASSSKGTTDTELPEVEIPVSTGDNAGTGNTGDNASSDNSGTADTPQPGNTTPDNSGSEGQPTPGETTEPGSEGSESSGGIIIDENGDIQLPEVP